MTSPLEFVSDGCTGFFDVWRGINLRNCCEAHDLAWYTHPGDWPEWMVSNIELARCFADAGAWEVAIGGFIAVCTFGALLFAGLVPRPPKPDAKPAPAYTGAFVVIQKEKAMISKADILELCPTAAPALVEAIVSGWHLADEAGINTPRRIRHFLARIAVETGGLRFVEESLTYTSVARLRAVWPTRFKSDEAARPFIRNPKKLAIRVYGGRLGNAPSPSADGWDFRGGGMMQTTGRENYRKMGFEDDPEALRDPDTAFATAVREWANRGCNELADADNVLGVCKAINGGTNGIAEQRAYLLKGERIWPDGAKADDDEAMLGAIQRALIEKGYPEVGIPNGEYGSRTRGAILAFEADHGREPTGSPSPELLAAILTSSPRVISEERAEGKPVGHPVLKDSGLLKTIAGTIGGGSLINVAGDLVAKVEGGAGMVSRLRSALAPILDLWPLLLVAGCVVVFWLAMRSRKAVVQDFRTGRLAQ